MTWIKWTVVAVAVVAAWVGTLALAVALAVEDDLAEDLAADGEHYAVDVAECGRPDRTEEETAAPTRTATGTLRNATDERRSFSLHVAFRTQDSVRVDWAPAVVDELGPGETARWQADSYLDRAGDADVTCEVAAVEYLPEGASLAATDAAGRPPLPPVVFSTSDNVDEAGSEGAGGTGDVGDIDAVSYVCYVVNPRVPVTCGTVSN